MASSSLGHYPGESQYGRLYTDNNWQQVEYTFGSGEIATIFITTTPRLLVVRRGPLCIKERETGVTLGRLLDHYDIFMTEKLKFKVFTVT